MKFALITLAFFQVLMGSMALAQTKSPATARALKKFEGVYKLVEQEISNHPKSDEKGVCYEQIQVSQPKGPNCAGCEIDLEIFGLPLGQGLIVEQMEKVNQGPQFHYLENPMFPGIMGTYQAEAKLVGNHLTAQYANRNLLGQVQHSRQFDATLEGSTLEYVVRNYRSINGFEDTTAHCRYQK